MPINYPTQDDHCKFKEMGNVASKQITRCPDCVKTVLYAILLVSRRLHNHPILLTDANYVNMICSFRS